MQHGVFLNTQDHFSHLKGKTALIREGSASDRVLAQFDDVTVPEAFGWHEFMRDEFSIEIRN